MAEWSQNEISEKSPFVSAEVIANILGLGKRLGIPACFFSHPFKKLLQFVSWQSSLCHPTHPSYEVLFKKAFHTSETFLSFLSPIVDPNYIVVIGHGFQLTNILPWNILSFHIHTYRVSQNNCKNPEHTKPLFWKYFLDFQAVGTYLCIYRFSMIAEDLHPFKAEKQPIIHVLSEVMERKTVSSCCFYYYGISKWLKFFMFIMF